MNIKTERLLEETEAAIVWVNGNHERVFVAFVITTLKNGQDCTFSYSSCREAINADREVNLVNARDGKISRAKKYLNNDELRYNDYTSVKEVNNSEFLLSEWGDDFDD